MEEIRIRKKMHPLLKAAIVLVILAVLVVGFCIWFKKKYTINPDTDIKIVYIGDHNRYTEQQIKEYVFDEWFEQYSILLRIYYKFKKIQPLTYTEKITISFDDDGLIVVKAYEKTPIGCLLVMNNYLYFDGDGMLIDTASENREKLPVIEGLEYTSLALGKVFETKKTELFPVIMNLVNQLQKYEVEANRIKFDSDNNVNLWCDGNHIILGIRNAYDVQINMLSGILKEIQGSETKYLLDLSEVETGTEKIVATVLPKEGAKTETSEE